MIELLQIPIEFILENLDIELKNKIKKKEKEISGYEQNFVKHYQYMHIEIHLLKQILAVVKQHILKITNYGMILTKTGSFYMVMNLKQNRILLKCY